MTIPSTKAGTTYVDTGGSTTFIDDNSTYTE